MKTIRLTQDQVALVDDEDFERVKNYKWFARKDEKDNTFYASHTINKNTKKGIDKSISLIMHRFIMNCPPDKIIDHADGNGLNNQKSNLRICTQKENGKNCSKQLLSRRITSSKYKGVHLYKKTGQYKATIGLNRERIHLGYFNTQEEAAEAYNKRAIEYHGEYAKLNKIIYNETTR